MTFWSGEKLKREMPSLVSDFTEHRIDCAAYTLRMGRQYYLSASEDQINTNKICQLEEGESLVIPSGQFAVLVTEEEVTIPPSAIAFISMKTGLKGRGLVNVSGFHVDPGYSARLRFSVFNAGPSAICVKQGDDSFLIWYADLDQEDQKNRKTEGQNRNYKKGISSGDMNSLSGPVKTVSVLAKKVDDLERMQMWMKLFMSVIGVLGTIVLGVIVFLAQEGIRSFLSKAGATIGLSI
ncbi:dCTP deaminase domain-containing protein [Pseudorhodoplanes sp.]|uniref:dCTP deaminase domain-containing protein n=1 Tax=Pseudorhodoplanes sp. TaxID=1934341 RepID=UPI003D0E71D4